ncbi:MAG: AraC family transcriptional regulator [Saprospiraceae bacterium]|nr:AraC family transcriptional regulator [Saprospiraceae bacterium]MCB0577290.1 AraC family transcriptional regulator [Saprospiraceae bacterium]
MKPVHLFNSISAYNAFNNHETLHPLVSVLDYSKTHPRYQSKMNFDIYCIVLKEVKCGDLKYGRHYYDYQEGTLVFISPGQVVEVENNGEQYQPLGHALAFHPDLMRGTSLAGSLSRHHFFGYHTSEALHLSERERQIVLDCFSKIQFELQQSIDKHSKTLIASNIELFLNYCERFYDRQFITREHVNKGILEKFETLLNDYFSSDKPQELGLPSVAYCARELNLSVNYFGDLVKRETGKSAQELIQNKIIDTAKDKIFDVHKTVNDVAYELGFKYPQHFSRLFKQKTGTSPGAYRMHH